MRPREGHRCRVRGPVVIAGGTAYCGELRSLIGSQQLGKGLRLLLAYLPLGSPAITVEGRRASSWLRPSLSGRGRQAGSLPTVECGIRAEGPGARYRPRWCRYRLGRWRRGPREFVDAGGGDGLAVSEDVGVFRRIATCECPRSWPTVLRSRSLSRHRRRRVPKIMKALNRDSCSST